VTYVLNTPDQQAEMLSTIGVANLETLLEQIPAACRLSRPLLLPPSLTELELEQELRELAGRNAGVSRRVCFLGGGAYDHFIPAVVDEIAGRGEFYTAYTPYQAEASQGSLQAFFEYQSLVCELTGMDASNASLYEGGSAVCEAVLMALHSTNRRKVVLAESLHPEYRQVVETYLTTLGGTVAIAPAPQGVVDPTALSALLDDQTAAVVVQHPNVFGNLEPVSAVSAAAHGHGAACIESFDPISLGLLKRPADLGADIAVAEGQSLGIPLQYGGPYLGILACKKEFLRKMPGRLIGLTTDRRGASCFVLNLQAREQHIRREKATSNICTNQGLMALRAAVYLAAVGPQGLREAAERSCRLAHYAAEKLSSLPGYAAPFGTAFFKEFVLLCPESAEQTQEAARRAGFDVGPSLERLSGWTSLSPELRERGLLVAATECRTREEIDGLAAALRSHGERGA
jgi:glycine dehydrogenase subunit 1